MGEVLLEPQARGPPLTAPRQAPCPAAESPGWLEHINKLRGELQEACIDILEPTCVGWCAAPCKNTEVCSFCYSELCGHSCAHTYFKGQQPGLLFTFLARRGKGTGAEP